VDLLAASAPPAGPRPPPLLVAPGVRAPALLERP
jgi:hypothetical protein